MTTCDMTVGRPGRNIIRFALPLIGGYILQQMYLIIDAAIVGRWIGVEALAAVGASSSIMFLIMGFCNGACAGFSIPVAQRFGAKDFKQMRIFHMFAGAESIKFGIYAASPTTGSFKAVFTDMTVTECQWESDVDWKK